MSSTPTLTGAWIAFAGGIASVLAHFNIIIPADGILSVLAALVALYGAIHQIVVHKVNA